MGPVELIAFLVFESLGPTELLILLVLPGIVWAVWRLTGGSRNRQEQLTARPKPDEPLQAHIAWYVHAGYRVVSQTDATAQLVKPKDFSFGWSVFWFLFFGVGVLVYLFYYAAKSDGTEFLTVSADGKVVRLGSGHQYSERNADDDARTPRIAATEKLRELKKLLDEGVITESEFAAKKSDLLRDL